MGGMSSLGIAVSGLNASQAGLYVTGHNIANMDTPGKTRQRVLQNESAYTTIGRSAGGLLQVGLGTDVGSITQVRDQYLDLKYRGQASKTAFYSAKLETVDEIQSIMGGLNDDGTPKELMDDLWRSFQYLTTNPQGLETRGTLITSAGAFINKFNDVADRLNDYQEIINDQIKSKVDEINKWANKINQLNGTISLSEASGDHANDYRDERNLALDELSKLANITYREDKTGRVDVYIENKELVAQGTVKHIGLRYVSDGSDFVEPVFTRETDILPATQAGTVDESIKPLFSDIANGRPVDEAHNNDNGTLKGLMLSRGSLKANYTTPKDVADRGVITKVQREMDILFNKVVTMINDKLSPYGTNLLPDPDAPKGVDDKENPSQHIELFVRKTVPRFDEVTGEYNIEESSKSATLYSMGNVQINPQLKDSDNYSKIPLSKSGAVNDVSLIQDILTEWQSSSGAYSPKLSDISDKQSFNQYYTQIITGIGEEGQTDADFIENQNKVMSLLENQRSGMSGISLDEEMKNMMTYQHAYNASAKIVNVIDGMLDKIINGMVR